MFWDFSIRRNLQDGGIGRLMRLDGSLWDWIYERREGCLEVGVLSRAVSTVKYFFLALVNHIGLLFLRKIFVPSY